MAILKEPASPTSQQVMSPDMFVPLFGVPKLSENFREWKEEMIAYLSAIGCWPLSIVQSPQDTQILGKIKFGLSKYSCVVEKANTSLEAWKLIEKEFEPPNEHQIFEIKHQLSNLKVEHSRSDLQKLIISIRDA